MRPPVATQILLQRPVLPSCTQAAPGGKPSAVQSASLVQARQLPASEAPTKLPQKLPLPVVTKQDPAGPVALLQMEAEMSAGSDWMHLSRSAVHEFSSCAAQLDLSATPFSGFFPRHTPEQQLPFLPLHLQPTFTHPN
jgi:hypothetical protein